MAIGRDRGDAGWVMSAHPADDPASPVTSGGTDVLNVGGTLTVDRSAASVGAGQTLDYTVSVTFN